MRALTSHLAGSLIKIFTHGYEIYKILLLLNLEKLLYRKMRLSYLKCFKFTMIGLTIVSIFISTSKMFDQHPIVNVIDIDTASLENNFINVQTVTVDASKNLDLCDVIHLATFVQCSNNTFELMLFLKSIFASRRHPLHLHIFVCDSLTKSVVMHMLDSWNVVGVDFSLYEIEDYISDSQSWMFKSFDPTAQWKMSIPIVLSHIEKVIVADVNLQIIGDIAIIWNKLSEMQTIGTRLGLVEIVHSRDIPVSTRHEYDKPIVVILKQRF